MRAIRSKDTKPEMLIRRALHARGYRYRLHRNDLPGKPDLVFPKYHAVIYVNGCFFHGHDCHLFKLPKNRTDFWREKITSNRLRDHSNWEENKNLGWRVAVIWQCALQGRKKLLLPDVISQIEHFLNGTGEFLEIWG